MNKLSKGKNLFLRIDGKFGKSSVRVHEATKNAMKC